MEKANTILFIGGTERAWHTKMVLELGGHSVTGAAMTADNASEVIQQVAQGAREADLVILEDVLPDSSPDQIAALGRAIADIDPPVQVVHVSHDRPYVVYTESVCETADGPSPIPTIAAVVSDL